jgi:hypothetical protein
MRRIADLTRTFGTQHCKTFSGFWSTKVSGLSATLAPTCVPKKQKRSFLNGQAFRWHSIPTFGIKTRIHHTCVTNRTVLLHIESNACIAART